MTSLSSYATMGLGIIQTMILSRALGPENVGALSLIRQIALFGAQIGSFGIPMALIYYINKERLDKNEVFNTSFWSIQLLSILSCIVIFILLHYTSFLGQYDFLSFIAIVFFIFFSNTRSLMQSLNIATQNVRKMSFVEIIPMLFTVILLIIFYFYQTLNLNKSLYLTVVFWPLMGLLCVYFINKHEIFLKFSFDKTFFEKSLKYGSVINLSDFLIIFNGSITLFVLQYFIKDLQSVGYLSRAISLTTLINTAFISFFRILYSHWSGLKGTELKKSVENILNILFFISLGATIFIMLTSKWLIIILFGSEFLPAKELVNILIVGASFYLLSKAFLKLFISDGKGRFNLICLIIAASSNFILSIVLIKIYGLIGAAYAQLISGILLTLSTCFFAKIKYEISLSKIFLPRKSLLNLRKLLKR